MLVCGQYVNDCFRPDPAISHARSIPVAIPLHRRSHHPARIRWRLARHQHRIAHLQPEPRDARLGEALPPRPRGFGDGHVLVDGEVSWQPQHRHMHGYMFGVVYGGLVVHDITTHAIPHSTAPTVSSPSAISMGMGRRVMHPSTATPRSPATGQPGCRSPSAESCS